jgi:hypothetical protein
MATDHILALLVRERDKVTRAIHALQGPTARKGRPPGSGRKAVRPSVEPDSSPAPGESTAPVKRKLSAAGRRAIIAGTKKRWAAIKAAKAAAPAPAAAPKTAPAKSPVRKGGLTAAGRKALSIAMKKRWAAKKKVAKGRANG